LLSLHLHDEQIEVQLQVERGRWGEHRGLHRHVLAYSHSLEAFELLVHWYEYLLR
jgi:hypothetical protein